MIVVTTTAESMRVVAPEIALALYAMGALLVAVYTGKDRAAQPILWTTAGVFVALALGIAFRGPETFPAFGGMFVEDAFARFAKIVVLLSAAAILVMSRHYMLSRDLLRFEYPILIAFSVIGMMVMVSAGDLMTLYMGLELQSLAAYVIAALRRDSPRSTEAGLKYFVLGSLASGLLLYGASLVYGFAGTTLFSGIFASTVGEVPLGLLFGLVFVISGLAFKVSLAPFHMWTPDVYEGSPTPVTAFFATAPKIAAMALFARVIHDAFGAAVDDWRQVLALLSVASMFLGGVAAIGQRDIKRLMAYSSISHMGYALMGLAAGTAFGVQAMLIYMTIYIVMNLGTFAFILTMERDGRPVTDIGSLHNYADREPTRALAMLVLLFSLAGVPPLVGFFAKYYVLLAAVQGGLGWLAVLGVIAAVINAFYYLRIVYYMYFGEEGEPLDRTEAPVQWGLLVGAALIMVFGIVNLFGIEGVTAQAAASLVE